MDEHLARLGYLELCISALRYYIVNEDSHECLRVIDDLARAVLELNQEFEGTANPE